MNELFGCGYMFSGQAIGCYVGATTRPDVRPGEHESALRNQRHYNLNFQAAVNEHGLESFTLIMTEQVKGLEEIAKAEQALIDEAKACGVTLFNKQQKATKHHPAGYSLSDETRERQSRSRRKRFVFISPGGDILVTFGLREFCAKHGLTQSQMSRVASGKVPTHKGWTNGVDGENQVEKLN